MARHESRLETDIAGKGWDEVQVADLMGWHEMYARCKLCARRTPLARHVVLRKFPKTAKLVDVQTRLKCIECKNRVANEIEVMRLPRQ